MEVVAAVASVAGILSLLGETLDGTRKLGDFFSEFSSASTTITKIVRDIRSLDQVISEIAELVGKLPPESKSTLQGSLHPQLQGYMKDVSRWLETAQDLLPASESGMKLWMKKLRIAVNIKCVNEIKGEMGKYKQDFSLSLSVLGRELDISTAAHVREVEDKVTQGTAASLSKIEKQDSMLQKIEIYSQSNMQSSAASVRSLDSIASSLSRLETMASSTDNLHGLCRRCSTEDENNELQVKRSAAYSRSSRSSAGSAVANKSAWISRKSSAAAMGPLAIQEEPRALGSLSYSEEYSDHNFPIDTEWRYDPLQKRNSDPVRKGGRQVSSYDDIKWSAREPTLLKSLGKFTDSTILGEEEGSYESRWNSQRLWDAFSEQQPESVLAYIAFLRKARILQNRIDALCLLDPRAGNSLMSIEEIKAQNEKRLAMQDRLEYYSGALRDARVRCILEGHSLYEIDKRLRLPISNDNSNKFWDQYNEPEETQNKTWHLAEMCKESNRNAIYGEEWVGSRDRTNRWMLHCLRSDDDQAQLHQSMLAEPPMDDEGWGSQVLSNWFIDGAATDSPQELAHSTGAVDSREASALEEPTSDPGPSEVKKSDCIDEATIFRSGILAF